MFDFPVMYMKAEWLLYWQAATRSGFPLDLCQVYLGEDWVGRGTTEGRGEEMLFFYHMSPSFLTNQMRQVWTPDLTRILKKVSSLFQCVLEGSSSGWIDALR